MAGGLFVGIKGEIGRLTRSVLAIRGVLISVLDAAISKVLPVS